MAGRRVGSAEWGRGSDVAGQWRAPLSVEGLRGALLCSWGAGGTWWPLFAPGRPAVSRRWEPRRVATHGHIRSQKATSRAEHSGSSSSWDGAGCPASGASGSGERVLRAVPSGVCSPCIARMGWTRKDEAALVCRGGLRDSDSNGVRVRRVTQKSPRA